MRRRDLLALALAAPPAVTCGDDVMPFPLAPWHMWGSSQRMRAVGGPPNRGVGSGQLAKINYKRPETWSFWLGAKLVGGDVNTTGADSIIRVLIDIQIGVGRSVWMTQQQQIATSIATAGFCRFEWTVPNGGIPGNSLTNVKYTSAVRSPPTLDSDPTTTDLIRTFCAQDIQCVASLIMVTGSPVAAVEAEVHAYFAPHTHIRPDWFQEADAAAFLGKETGGT